MTWLAVRLLRPYVVAAFVLSALSTVVILVASAVVQRRLDASGLPDCVNPNTCYQAGTPMLLMELTAAVVPSLLGLLLGVPLFAREREDDTMAFALTRSVPPGRWVLTKLAVAGFAGVLATGIMATAYRLVAARYTLLANDTYELLDLFHLNHIAFMVMRTVLTLAVAALLGLTTGSTVRTGLLSVALWPFGLLAACGAGALLPAGRPGTSTPAFSPDDDRYWTADISFLDPFAWSASAVTALLVVGLVMLTRRAVDSRV